MSAVGFTVFCSILGLALLRIESAAPQLYSPALLLFWVTSPSIIASSGTIVPDLASVAIGAGLPPLFGIFSETLHGMVRYAAVLFLASQC